LPAFIRIPAVFGAIALSTLLHTTPLFFVAFLKWLLPPLRPVLGRVLVRIAESWIGFNSWLVDHATPTRVRVSGIEDLDARGHYLVLANHRSWVDIVALQYALNRRAPFLRFFLKRELIWVPFLGLAWWALDFPFMRRACEKFRGMPVAIMNFVEGTRFTPAKHARQGGDYRHLLRPKSGGVAFALEAMGEGLQSVLDATIAYPGGTPTMVDLFGGRVPEIVVEVTRRPIPPDLIGTDYEADQAARVRYQRWLNGLWEEKDARLDALQGSKP
jgi:1-acyl-sn-glycerol-3-phosphate acyltransferase